MKTLYGKAKDAGAAKPFLPEYGGLPVKLTTHVGDLIIAREDETVDILKERVEQAMREMIAQHQVQGGGVGKAVVQRLKLLF